MVKRIIPFVLYSIITLGCFVLWIPFPDCYHFAGASSLIYSLVFAIGSNNPALIWTTLCFLPAVICLFGIAMRLIIKQDNSFLFFFLMTMDVIVTLAFIILKICTINHTGVSYMIVGIITRTLYLLWSLHFTRKNRHNVTGDGSKPLKK